jgi:hypothetical protein
LRSAAIAIFADISTVGADSVIVADSDGVAAEANRSRRGALLACRRRNGEVDAVEELQMSMRRTNPDARRGIIMIRALGCGIRGCC